ncbi:TonB-dependent receptor [Sphingobium sp.]|uniref:TonB-dependent receptor n=1 Tax=Sphingobium sp. TaxID=1912891 RepID=UPI003918D36E
MVASGSAWAQTGSSDNDASASSTDIVVTAQRREQSSQDVGIAIAAFSGDALTKMGLSKSSDIAQLTPGVFVSGSIGGQTQQFTVRGVTQSDFSDAVEAPVAVYIDDVYVSTQQGQTLALFDIDRVEILKGPQGTLFGRNATGGLVHTVIAKPNTDALGGFVNLSYARFNEVKAEGALNVPLSSTAAFRVSGYYNRIDNYWKNRYPEGVVTGAPQNFAGPDDRPQPCCQNEGGGKTYAGRAQLLLEPSDDLKIRLSASGARQHLSTGPYTSVATIGTYDDQGRLIQSDRVSPTETRIAIGPDGGNYTFPVDGTGLSGATRAPGATWFGYVPLDPKNLELSSDFARSDLNRVSVWTASAHVDYTLGSVDIASITAYQRHKKQLLMDADGGATNVFAFGARADTKIFSQELRASGGDAGFRWTTGAYFLDIKADAIQALLGPSGSFLSLLVVGDASQGIDIVPHTNLHTQSFSVFGQTEVGLADKWTLILGGRVIREHQEDELSRNIYLNTDDYGIDTDTLLFPYGAPYSDRRTSTLWAAKAQLEYRPVEKLLIYAGINRGVKGGSYNAPGIGSNVTTDQLSYKPEVLLNYEGGFKYGDRFFSLNASGFYYDYKDYQAFRFANASGFVQNVDSKVYGFELDAGVQIFEGLRATAGASYTHGTIKNFEIAPDVFRTVRPTYSPRTQVSASLNYEVPGDVAGGRLSFNAQGNYASGFYHNIRNFNSDWFKGRTLANLSMNWRQEPTGLSLTAYINNVTDKRYGMIGFNNVANCGCSDESYGMPRTYGMTIGYRF